MMDRLNLTGKRILITGAAGFIGANLAERLLKTERPARVIGIDNLNDYYDVRIKEWRLARIAKAAADAAAADTSGSCSGERDGGTESIWHFVKGDISDADTVRSLFAAQKPDIVVNLAAQAGVRYSITNPDAYIQSNLIGFYNILEACRHSTDGYRPGTSRKTDAAADGIALVEAADRNAEDAVSYQGVQHLVYASSSSVYGTNQKVPFSTQDRVDDPVSLYAATKKSDELMAHAYAKLYDIPMTGLRFFTVYGPAGRPDMAYFGFTDQLRAGRTIRIFNYGNCSRDFTYIDDIVEGTLRVIKGAPSRATGPDGLPVPPYALYNIGGGRPESLLDFVDILQQELIRAGVLPQDYDFEAHTELVPMQPGDVPVTYADTADLERDFGYRPQTDLRTGLRAFAQWYRAFYMD